MTDEELATIQERWQWISHDLLPDANQAKVDVRALYDEVKRAREALRQEQREHANCEQFHDDVNLAQVQFAGILAQQNEQLREIVRAVAEADNSDHGVCYQLCQYHLYEYNDGDNERLDHTEPCVYMQARAILGMDK